MICRNFCWLQFFPRLVKWKNLFWCRKEGKQLPRQHPGTHLCPSTRPGLLSGTFSDKLSRYPRRSAPSTQGGEVESSVTEWRGESPWLLQSELCWLAARRGLRRSQASGYDRSGGQSLGLSAHPFVMLSGQVWASSVFRCPAYMDFTWWDPHAYQSLQMRTCLGNRADISGVWGVPVTLRTFPLRASLALLSWFSRNPCHKGPKVLISLGSRHLGTLKNQNTQRGLNHRNQIFVLYNRR